MIQKKLRGSGEPISIVRDERTREPKVLLGNRGTKIGRGGFLRQKKYTLDILAETGLLDCKPVDTPIIVNHGLQLSEGGRASTSRQISTLGWEAHLSIPH